VSGLKPLEQTLAIPKLDWLTVNELLRLLRGILIVVAKQVYPGNNVALRSYLKHSISVLAHSGAPAI